MVRAQQCQRLCWAWCCWLLLCIVCCHGQGLVTNTRISSTLVSSRALANAYRSATARRAAEFRRLMAAVRTSCVSRAGQSARLCATAVKGSAASLDADALRLAMGPNSFSGRAYTYLSPPKDQKGCATCVAFCIAAAAEITAAKVLGIPGSTVDLSEQDIAFCPTNPDALKFCSTGTDLASSMARLNDRIVDESCLPYTVAPGKDAAASLCRYRCNKPAGVWAKGRYEVVSLSDSIPLIQFFIRRYGAVITRLNIFSDFRPFFKANPKGIYEGKGCSDGVGVLEEEHAVVLVGFDNTGEYWIARNSWGPSWGDGGYLKIKYGVCGVGASGDTFAMTYAVKGGPAQSLPSSTPDPEEPGCHLMKATRMDTLWSVADALDVDAIELLANNSGIIDSPTVTLAGRTISICSVGPNSRYSLPKWVSTPDAVVPTAPVPTPAALPMLIPVAKPAPAPKVAPVATPAPAPRVAPAVKPARTPQPALVVATPAPVVRPAPAVKPPPVSKSAPVARPVVAASKPVAEKGPIIPQRIPVLKPIITPAPAPRPAAPRPAAPAVKRTPGGGTTVKRTPSAGAPKPRSPTRSTPGSRPARKAPAPGPRKAPAPRKAPYRPAARPWPAAVPRRAPAPTPVAAVTQLGPLRITTTRIVAPAQNAENSRFVFRLPVFGRR